MTIDRENVIKGLECCEHPYAKKCDTCPYSFHAPDSMECTAYLSKDALILLRKQEPVAHATWLYKETITAYDECGVKTWAVKHRCSKCGFVNIAIEAHTGQYSYCPNCGAKMDDVTNTIVKTEKTPIRDMMVYGVPPRGERDA